MRAVLAWIGAVALYPLPHHLLSRLMLRFTRIRARWVREPFIRFFVGRFAPDLSEAQEPDPFAYQHFNAFFTRALRPDARPLPPASDRSTLVSPVDGAVSQADAIAGDRMIQAKGREYTATALLGGDVERAARYQGGDFTTLYLAPRDYHRIHMPVDGALERMVYVPGRLFSVNEASARHVPGLFARNERVVCHFQTPVGPMAMVLVGAMFVGSMETVWAGTVTPARERDLRAWDYGETGDSPRLARGEEMGRFNMGSTVILLFGAGAVRFSNELVPGAPVRMGSAIGHAVAEGPGQA